MENNLIFTRFFPKKRLFVVVLAIFFPIFVFSQDPDIQEDPPGFDEIFRTSEVADEQPTNRYQRMKRMTKRVSAPPNGVRVGCLCMSDVRSATVGTGACSGQGGVRYWFYKLPGGDTVRVSTRRNESHPELLTEAEKGAFVKKRADRTAKSQLAAALAGQPIMVVAAPNSPLNSLEPNVTMEAFDRVYVLVLSFILLAALKMLLEWLKPLREKWLNALRN